MPGPFKIRGRWALVTAFCARHQLPPSAAFLRTLAAAGDWVGLLWQAAVQGPSASELAAAVCCVPHPHLRHHLMHVLRRTAPAPALSLAPVTAYTPYSTSSRTTDLHSHTTAGRRGGGDGVANAHCSPHHHTPARETEVEEELEMAPELFALVGRCEGRADGGRVLLSEAVRWRWPLLAVVGACLDDVCGDTCLLAWLQASEEEESQFDASEGLADHRCVRHLLPPSAGPPLVLKPVFVYRHAQVLAQVP